MLKFIICFCSVFFLAAAVHAESYADLMNEAEKLTVKYFEKGSRAYKIKSKELDRIANSNIPEAKKNAELRKIIDDLKKSNDPITYARVLLDGNISEQEAAQARSLLEKNMRNSAEANYWLGKIYQKGIGIAPDEKKAENFYLKSFKMGYKEAASDLGRIYSAKIKNNAENRMQAEYYYECSVANGKIEDRVMLARLYASHPEDLSAMQRTIAIRWLKPLADSNDDSAMVQLAGLYKGTENKKMMMYLYKAAKQNNRDAIYRLGLVYWTGYPVHHDYSRAFNYLKRAYEAGNQQSKIILARMYRDGKGISPDQKKSFRLFKELFDAGDNRASLALGYYFYDGKIVEKNYKKASEYLNSGLLSLTDFEEYKPWTLLGMIYYNGGYGVKKDLKQAANCFKNAEKEQSPDACYYLGLMYANGQGGLAQNDSKAFEYFKKAAPMGHMKAKYELGKCYYYGKGVRQDYVSAELALSSAADYGNLEACLLIADYLFDHAKNKEGSAKAFHFYSKLVLNKNAHALSRCGQMMLVGRGTMADEKTAKEYLKKAADLQDPEAMYYWGIVERDNKNYVQAIKYLHASAEKGNRNAMYAFAEMAIDNNDINIDKKLAIHYLRALADLGNIKAQEQFAVLCEKGMPQLVNQDPALAVIYYEKAYQQKSVFAGVKLAHLLFKQEKYAETLKLVSSPLLAGNPDIYALHGRLYYEGKGVERNPAKALPYLRLAADQKNLYACEAAGRLLFARQEHKAALTYLETASVKRNPAIWYMLGYIWHRGTAGKKDFTRALEYLLLASEAMNTDAMLELSNMYQLGNGVERDYAQSLYWCQKAAKNGSTEAMYQTGNKYFNGIGTTPDARQAFEWFLMAAKQGHTSAISEVIHMYEKGNGVNKDPAEALKWRKKQ